MGLIEPAKVCALDIETLERPIPEGLRAAKAKEFREKAEAAYKKQETIDAHAVEDFEKWKERWKFTRRGSKVLCVGLGMVDLEMPGLRHGEFQCVCSEDEEVACHRAHDFLVKYNPQKIVTANGYAFDLPIMMAAFARHDLGMPAPFGKWDFWDLFKDPWEKYANGCESLESLAEIYGVDFPEEALPVADYSDPDGSMVAEMWERDKEDGKGRVCNYCLRDVWVTAEITAKIARFVRM